MCASSTAAINAVNVWSSSSRADIDFHATNHFLAASFDPKQLAGSSQKQNAEEEVANTASEKHWMEHLVTRHSALAEHVHAPPTKNGGASTTTTTHSLAVRHAFRLHAHSAVSTGSASVEHLAVHLPMASSADMVTHVAHSVTLQTSTQAVNFFTRESSEHLERSESLRVLAFRLDCVV
jgi:hypothetical protein